MFTIKHLKLISVVLSTVFFVDSAAWACPDSSCLAARSEVSALASRINHFKDMDTNGREETVRKLKTGEISAISMNAEELRQYMILVTDAELGEGEAGEIFAEYLVRLLYACYKEEGKSFVDIGSEFRRIAGNSRSAVLKNKIILDKSRADSIRSVLIGCVNQIAGAICAAQVIEKRESGKLGVTIEGHSSFVIIALKYLESEIVMPCPISILVEDCLDTTFSKVVHIEGKLREEYEKYEALTRTSVSSRKQTRVRKRTKLFRGLLNNASTFKKAIERARKILHGSAIRATGAEGASRPWSADQSLGTISDVVNKAPRMSNDSSSGAMIPVLNWILSKLGGDPLFDIEYTYLQGIFEQLLFWFAVKPIISLVFPMLGVHEVIFIVWGIFYLSHYSDILLNVLGYFNIIDKSKIPERPNMSGVFIMSTANAVAMELCGIGWVGWFLDSVIFIIMAIYHTVKNYKYIQHMQRPEEEKKREEELEARMSRDRNNRNDKWLRKMKALFSRDDRYFYWSRKVDVSTLEEIGNGNDAKVYKMPDRSYVVKVFHEGNGISKNELEQLVKFNDLLLEANVPVVPMRIVELKGGKHGILMPFIEGENLADRMNRLQDEDSHACDRMDEQFKEIIVRMVRVIAKETLTVSGDHFGLDIVDHELFTGLLGSWRMFSDVNCQSAYTNVICTSDGKMVCVDPLNVRAIKEYLRIKDDPSALKNLVLAQKYIFGQPIFPETGSEHPSSAQIGKREHVTKVNYDTNGEPLSFETDDAGKPPIVLEKMDSNDLGENLRWMSKDPITQAIISAFDSDQVYLFDELRKDLFGFARTSDGGKTKPFIALHRSLQADYVALFHEIGEYLMRIGVLEIELNDAMTEMTVKVNGVVVNEEPIKLTKAAIKQAKKINSNPGKENHYKLRALQAVLFEEPDRGTTKWIRTLRLLDRNPVFREIRDCLNEGPQETVRSGCFAIAAMCKAKAINDTTCTTVKALMSFLASNTQKKSVYYYELLSKLAQAGQITSANIEDISGLIKALVENAGENTAFSCFEIINLANIARTTNLPIFNVKLLTEIVKSARTKTSKSISELISLGLSIQNGECDKETLDINLISGLVKKSKQHIASALYTLRVLGSHSKGAFCSKDIYNIRLIDKIARCQSASRYKACGLVIMLGKFSMVTKSNITNVVKLIDIADSAEKINADDENFKTGCVFDALFALVEKGVITTANLTKVLQSFEKVNDCGVEAQYIYNSLKTLAEYGLTDASNICCRIEKIRICITENRENSAFMPAMIGAIAKNSDARDFDSIFSAIRPILRKLGRLDSNIQMYAGSCAVLMLYNGISARDVSSFLCQRDPTIESVLGKMHEMALLYKDNNKEKTGKELIKTDADLMAMNAFATVFMFLGGECKFRQEGNGLLNLLKGSSDLDNLFRTILKRAISWSEVDFTKDSATANFSYSPYYIKEMKIGVLFGTSFHEVFHNILRENGFDWGTIEKAGIHEFLSDIASFYGLMSIGLGDLIEDKKKALEYVDSLIQVEKEGGRAYECHVAARAQLEKIFRWFDKVNERRLAEGKAPIDIRDYFGDILKIGLEIAVERKGDKKLTQKDFTKELLKRLKSAVRDRVSPVAGTVVQGEMGRTAWRRSRGRRTHGVEMYDPDGALTGEFVDLISKTYKNARIEEYKDGEITITAYNSRTRKEETFTLHPEEIGKGDLAIKLAACVTRDEDRELVEAIVSAIPEDLKFLRFPEEELHEDLFGLSSKEHKFIALHAYLADDPIAVLHEVGHFLEGGTLDVGRGTWGEKGRQGEILKINLSGNGKRLNVHLSDRLFVVDLEGEARKLAGYASSIGDRSRREHYYLRALQRQLFGKHDTNVPSDVRLTAKIKAKQLLRDLGCFEGADGVLSGKITAILEKVLSGEPILSEDLKEDDLKALLKNSTRFLHGLDIAKRVAEFVEETVEDEYDGNKAAVVAAITAAIESSGVKIDSETYKHIAYIKENLGKFIEIFESYSQSGILSEDGERLLGQLENEAFLDNLDAVSESYEVMKYFLRIQEMDATDILEHFPQRYFREIDPEKIPEDAKLGLIDGCANVCPFCPFQNSARMRCMPYPLVIMLAKYAKSKIDKDYFIYEPLYYEDVCGAMYYDVSKLFRCDWIVSHGLKLGEYDGVALRNIDRICKAGVRYRSIEVSVNMDGLNLDIGEGEDLDVVFERYKKYFIDYVEKVKPITKLLSFRFQQQLGGNTIAERKNAIISRLSSELGGFANGVSIEPTLRPYTPRSLHEMGLDKPTSAEWEASYGYGVLSVSADGNIRAFMMPQSYQYFNTVWNLLDDQQKRFFLNIISGVIQSGQMYEYFARSILSQEVFMKLKSFYNVEGVGGEGLDEIAEELSRLDLPVPIDLDFMRRQGVFERFREVAYFDVIRYEVASIFKGEEIHPQPIGRGRGRRLPGRASARAV